MGVVFEEVVGEVETTPQPPEQRQQSDEQQQSPQQDAYCWRQHQATLRRRQQRLEAD